MLKMRMEGVKGPLAVYLDGSSVEAKMKPSEWQITCYFPNSLRLLDGES